MAAILAAVSLLSSCASHEVPKNREPENQGQAYQARYRAPTGSVTEITRATYLEALKCRGRSEISDAAPEAGKYHSERLSTHGVILSTGDLVEVFVEDDDILSGSFVVGGDGRIRLPFARPVAAAGRTTEDVERSIQKILLEEGLYEVTPRVSVILRDYSEVAVFVSGAVFEPRQVFIGGATAQTRDVARQQALGASTRSRTLSAALRGAGGIRPDADLAGVTLVRGGARTRYDLRNAVTGGAFADPVLISGDRIEVASRQCFQDELMVPSSITPPGVKVFLSNLAETALANNPAATPDAREMRYGTRFLQAVFGLNCVGGSKLTNANRRAVLFSRNPVSGESIVIDRSIEDLLRMAERDEFNPYILPEDSIACYDSATVSLRNLAAAVGIVAAAVYIVE